MAFTEQEKQIIVWGRANGKTQQEVEQALVRVRTGQGPVQTEQAKPSTALSLAKGAAKGIAGIVPDTVEALNMGGNAIIAAVDPNRTYADVKGEQDTALEELGVAPAIQAIDETLAPDNTAETVAYHGAQLLSPFAKAGAVKAVAGLSKGTELLAGITKKGAEGITEATSRAVAPDAIMQRVARIPKQKQANFEKMTGESVGTYLVNRGIFGDVDEITEQLGKRFIASRNQADKALASLEGNFKSTAVGNALKQLSQREARISTAGAVSKDKERVQALLKKHNGEGLNMTEVNEVKRLFERNVRVEYMRENNSDTIAAATNLDSAIRQWQFDKASELGLKTLPDINKETQAAKQLLDDMGVEYAGSAGNNAITLTDWIILAGGDPTAVGGFLAKRLLSSKKFMSGIAKKLSGTPSKQELPSIELGEPTIDNFAKFIRAIEGRAKPPTPQR